MMRLKPVRPLIPLGQTIVQGSADKPVEFDPKAYAQLFMQLTDCAQAGKELHEARQRSLERRLERRAEIKKSYVPILLSPSQASVYQELLGKRSPRRNQLKISQILDTISFHPTDDRLQCNSKLSFINDFLLLMKTSLGAEADNKKKDFTLAIVCHSAQSESKLLSRLISNLPWLNIRHLSSFATLRGVYGVVVRVQNDEDAMDSISVNLNIDLIFIYEPAVGELPSVEQLFEETGDVPFVLDLVTLSTPEQLFYERDEAALRIPLDETYEKINCIDQGTVLKDGFKLIDSKSQKKWNSLMAVDVSLWMEKNPLLNYKLKYDRVFKNVKWKLNSKLKLDLKVLLQTFQANISRQAPSVNNDDNADGSGLTSEAVPKSSKKKNNKRDLENDKLKQTSTTELPPQIPVFFTPSSNHHVDDGSGLDSTTAPESCKKQDNKRPLIESEPQQAVKKMKAMGEAVEDAPISDSTEPVDVEMQGSFAATTYNLFVPALESIFKTAMDEFEKDINNIKIKF